MPFRRAAADGRAAFSLRGRLLLLLLGPLLVIVAVSGVIGYFQAVYYAQREYDQSLYDHTHSLALLVEKHGRRISLNMPRQARRMFLWGNIDSTYYQIATGDKVLAGEAVFPEPAKDSRVLRFDDLIIFDGEVRGTPVRAARLLIDRPEFGQPVQVNVAETQFRRESLAQNILMSVLAPQLVLILIVAVVVWFGVNRSLRPLARMTRSLERQTQHRISPVSEEGVPREVRPLSGAINELLRRLEQALEAQRQFIANAAHQLRTPLTAMRLNMERLREPLTREEREETVEYLQRSVERAIRLSQQLLTLARAEPGSLSREAFEPVDLAALARETGMSWVPLAMDREVELQFEGPSRPVMVSGHPTLLQEALSNLIDNAIKYGGKPGRVLVRVADAPTPSLAVLDSGPGIPREAGDQVFQRFYRGDQGGEGSGLGLSIVKDIATLHEAGVTLTEGLDGRGLGAVMTFPAAVSRIVPAATP